ncbi:hypothetical protein Hdeb2414_s0016g00476241 [Helianthus debilis subsp. tardiflorus]
MSLSRNGGRCVWLKIPIPGQFVLVSQIISHCLSLEMPAMKKKAVYVVFILTLWKLWININERVFEHKFVAAASIVESIKVESYWWMMKRSKIARLSMDNWRRFEDLDFG